MNTMYSPLWSIIFVVVALIAVLFTICLSYNIRLFIALTKRIYKEVTKPYDKYFQKLNGFAFSKLLLKSFFCKESIKVAANMFVLRRAQLRKMDKEAGDNGESRGFRMGLRGQFNPFKKINPDDLNDLEDLDLI